MRTGNPSLSDNAFRGYAVKSPHLRMSINGVVNKSFLLLFIALLSAGFTWSLYSLLKLPLVSGLMWLGIIGGFILALVTIFKKEWSPFTAPAYALLEGFAIGGISVFFESIYPGIVLQAVALTFGTLFVMLLVYKTGLIKVTNNFRLGILIATGAIALIYIISLVGSFFGWNFPYIHDSGPIGIIFSLIVVAIASLNLILDFDFIKKNVGHSPRFMEWFAAFALMVTLIWLYFEILRLLTKLRSRD